MNCGSVARERAISTRRRSPPGQTVATLCREVGDLEFSQQVFEAMLAFRPGQPRTRLEYRHDVVSYREMAKYRRLLRQVPEPCPGTQVHRSIGEIGLVEMHGAGVARHQPDNHVEAGRLAGTVRTEQPYDLPALHGEADVVDDEAIAVALCESARGENGHRGRWLRGGSPGRRGLSRISTVSSSFWA